MIPIGDRNPTHRTPVLTITLILLNVLAFLYELSLSDAGLPQFFDLWAIIPVQLVTMVSAEAITLFSSMFLHGGWSHLLGNMLYLWVFGDNIEDRLGRGRFIAFYLICGVVAGLAQVIIEPTSQVPIVGASGAIAGILGGYLILFPQVRVRTLIPIPILFFPRVELPAILVLGFWFLMQFFNGIAQIGTMQVQGGGVAFFAHIGGFIAGLLLVRLFGGKKSAEPWRD